MATTRRTRMPMAAKLAPAVVVAGTALGWLLGSAATPVMKQRAEPWQHAVPQGSSLSTAVASEGWPNLVPEALQPASTPYPDLGYDSVGSAQWDGAEGQPGADLAPPAPLIRARDAAQRAEQAAEEAAQAIVPPALDRPEAAPEARKSALGRSGLY